MKTLLLDQTNWDLVIDASNNIAVADDPYSQAQDAASECKLFQGELYYDKTRGIPYWGQILGYAVPLNYMRSKYKAAALLVPDVTQSQAFIASIVNRKVSGQVLITNAAGQTAGVSF